MPIRVPLLLLLVLQVRLYEAAKLQFHQVIFPASNHCDLKPCDLSGMKLIPCKTLRQVLEVLFGEAFAERKQRINEWHQQRRRRTSSRRTAAAGAAAAADDQEQHL